MSPSSPVGSGQPVEEQSNREITIATYWGPSMLSYQCAFHFSADPCTVKFDGMLTGCKSCTVRF